MEGTWAQPYSDKQSMIDVIFRELSSYKIDKDGFETLKCLIQDKLLDIQQKTVAEAKDGSKSIKKLCDMSTDQLGDFYLTVQSLKALLFLTQVAIETYKAEEFVKNGL